MLVGDRRGVERVLGKDDKENRSREGRRGEWVRIWMSCRSLALATRVYFRGSINLYARFLVL